MYLPLTGYQKHCEKRGIKMKVGSISSQMVRPMQPNQAVQTQNQNVNNQDNKQESHDDSNQVTSEKFKNHHSKCSMSTEDFLQLHNSSTEDMVDAIKDVMALKVLEKTLEVIDKITSS
jgi:molecular chaperone GrpE (heat shock protein)